MKKELGRDFVVLEDAFELLVTHKPRQGAPGAGPSIEVQIIPTWIPPFSSAAKDFKVRVDAKLNLSNIGDEGFYAMVRGMIGQGLVMPTAGPRIR